MKPLSYFIDTQFSRALMGEYGQYLENLKSDIEWLDSVACTVDDYSLALSCHDNINYTSYTQAQRSLFKLALDIYEQESSLTRFRELLTEYV